MIQEPLRNRRTCEVGFSPRVVQSVVCALGCLAAAAAEAAEKKLPMQGEVFTIEDRDAFVILPPKTEAKAPIPWVWYAPTLPGLPGNAEKWMFDKFLQQGVAIAGVDVGESYGNAKGRAIYSALYKELVENRGFARRACLLARSRGGLMLYSWAAENPDSVACIAGIYPVCNLSSYPGLARACGAYGMTKERLAAELARHNPIDRLAPLAKAEVPIFHIHGDRDTVVPLEKNSGELAKRYSRLGGKMTLEVVKGQGHNMWAGWFHSQALVDFVIGHAGREATNKANAGGPGPSDGTSEVDGDRVQQTFSTVTSPPAIAPEAPARCPWRRARGWSSSDGSRIGTPPQRGAFSGRIPCNLGNLLDWGANLLSVLAVAGNNGARGIWLHVPGCARA